MEVGEQIMSDVIISKKERSVFHELFCPYVKRIAKNNRKQISENEARNRGYCECKFCRSVRGIVYKYREILADAKDATVHYDAIDNAMCVRTDYGFWKLIWRDNVQEWHVFHMNHKGYRCFDPTLSTEMLMRGRFHRQEDMRSETNVGKIIKYIRAHDRNYHIAETNIRKMSKATANDRRRYKQQKNRKRTESIRNVYKTLKYLKKEN